MDQYIQKYGDNAIQAYKKSLRHSESLQKDYPSPIKQQPHLLPKKSLSKRSLKSHISKRQDSQSKLVHSKSIKNSQKFDDEPRKKGSSFIDGNKRALASSALNGFGHTFSKLGNNPNQNRKKLVITESNTPKCSTPKMHINLNLHNQKRQNQQKHNNQVYQNEMKDKLTERIQRSSGKKQIDKCSTSQSKHQTKRSFLGSIQSRLEDMLISSKATLRSLELGMRECFDILLMNQDDIRLRKVFLLMKEIFEKAYKLGQRYRQKYSRATQKISQMEVIQETYLMKNSNGQLHGRTKSKLEGQGGKSNKKQSSIQTIIINENYELRRKVNKLQKQLQYYTSQNVSLNNVFGKFKNSQSQLRFSSHNQQHNQQHQSDLYRQFHNHENEHYNNSSMKQKHLGFSNNKLQKRRSSQNLLHNSNLPHEHGFSYGIEKRLSFDPALLETGSDVKKNSTTNNHHNSAGPHTLYNSIGSSQYNEGLYQDDHQFRRLNRNNEVQELSEEEDSQNE